MPSRTQRFFLAIFPKSWGESMEADSRRWKSHCKCGGSISIWDLGGLRYKAAGRPLRGFRCRACGSFGLHPLAKD